MPLSRFLQEPHLHTFRSTFIQQQARTRVLSVTSARLGRTDGQTILKGNRSVIVKALAGGMVVMGAMYYYFNVVLPDKVYQRARDDFEKRVKFAAHNVLSSAQKKASGLIAEGGEILKESGIGSSAEDTRDVLRKVTGRGKDVLKEVIDEVRVKYTCHKLVQMN
ncbi:hypothetical protein M427DRAFT_162897 [Gonapodya prolifera JEL478]|uniref:Uncharacterized protein n=1 Tax=Gonapodya prolifera (strain JEL478) TaxID=1344416 RepID=A0A139AZA6_GONPJ|nr:hypothetical protein M427DRAFT_162897 [Gonapodya prolifera JEL478]|eukprot:KXS22049.1 hypothetical protein M427DRAFT_162897 [Gonapodya prolifera JEL478]